MISAKRIKPVKLLFFLLSAIIVCSPAKAYPPEIRVLERSELKSLSDEAILDTYIDAVVEIEAMRAFFSTSGFTPRDYKSYKNLLRYRILLIEEMEKRSLKKPTV